MNDSIERRGALKQLVGFSLVALGLDTVFQGCGSSSSPASAPGSAGPGPSPTPQPSGASGACVTHGTVTEVEGDALHRLVVPKEDVATGTEKSYHIQGLENHDHIVTLSAQDFATLRQGNSLRLQSGVSIGPVAPHFHFVDVSCAS